MRQILKAGAIYFLLVFGAGFILGSIRVLLILPRVGERTAELMEMPIMLLVTILAARWVSRRFVNPATGSRLFAVGFAALCLLLAAELTFVFVLRGLTIREYLASRDPVAGTVFAVMLLVFAIMPYLVTREAQFKRAGFSQRA
jgi:hypothetical protein